MKSSNSTISFYLLTAFTVVCVLTVFASNSDTLRDFSMVGLSVLSLCWITLTFILTRRDSQATGEQREPDLTNDDRNFNQIYGIIESSIKEDLAVVRSEIKQMKSLIADAVATLGKSFSAMNVNVQEQNTLVAQLIEPAPNGYKPTVIVQIEEKTEQIRLNTADAVRSLQFEDIAVQVADNSIQYLDNIEKFLDNCNRQLNDLGNPNSQNTQVDNGFQGFIVSLQQLRRQHQLPERKAANQQDLSEGGVELF